MNSRFSLSLFSLLGATFFPACSQAQTQPPALKIEWPARSNQVAPAGKDIAAQVVAARAILDGWQNQNPVRGERWLRIVYWTPADREPAPQYRERLSKIMLDIQAFYAREMERNGFGPRTFELKKGADGLLDMVVAHGSKTRDHYSGDTGDEIRVDSMAALKAAGIDGDKETFLIFCNLGDWDAQKRTISGSSPYYAYGTTRKGTAWQSDSPILNIDSLLNVNEADKVQSSQYGHITLAHYNSIFIGGITHELGHALSMPHNLERPDEAPWGKALMGSGNRTYGEELRGDANTESKGHGSFLPFSDALRLASHPSFSGSIKGIEDEANATVSEVKLTTDGQTITYSAKVTANPPVYGVIGYMDPTGGQDYDATTTTAIPDKEGRFSLNCNALVKGKSGTLRVVMLQVNGAATSAAAGGGTSPQYPYNVSAEGVVDLNLWNTEQQLAPLAVAVSSGQRDQVEKVLKDLQAQHAPANVLEIARVQLDNYANKLNPTPAGATGNSLYLSEAEPTSAQVGWLQPTYNRLPIEENSNPLLAAGGQYYARGIYAHAPASHVYDLGGKWNRLSGTAGAAQGKGASVVFVVLGDGKELWRSQTVHEGEVAPFEINVEGVKSLELRVEDGGNGNSSDWGVWLDPRITR